MIISAIFQNLVRSTTWWRSV